MKNSQFERRKFRRQSSIKKFIVDFYCPEEKLIIELDGDFHFDEKAIKAKFKDGLLEMTLPKLEKEKRHSIKIE